MGAGSFGTVKDSAGFFIEMELQEIGPGFTQIFAGGQIVTGGKVQVSIAEDVTGPFASEKIGQHRQGFRPQLPSTDSAFLHPIPFVLGTAFDEIPIVDVFRKDFLDIGRVEAAVDAEEEDKASVVGGMFHRKCKLLLSVIGNGG